MHSVSVIIPNYNGQHLLAKHLPAVLKILRSGDELVVIDDKSTDNSWVWLQQQFEKKIWQVGKKKGPVILVQNHQNIRFAASCNRAVRTATRSLVFLLNSDVAPYPDILDHLTAHFDDSSVFAVGCLEHEPNESGETISGKNTLQFQRGMFIHQRATDFTSGETAWASGGSAIFDRQKWLDLGGFDQDYYPAYWEDVDLSYRAKKRGWKVLFDQQAQVEHRHESTNTSAFGKKKMEAMSWQHAHTFIWKHANWKQKLLYICWQPYWWMKVPIYARQQLQLVLFALVVLIAFVTRAYSLGQIPHGMTWDEAAIGYNAFSVATTGRDEWLIKLPISFRSFGDYKAPLAIYITGVFIRLFGLSLTVVRLPFMLAGVMAVIGMMAITYLLWSEWIDKPHQSQQNQFPILNSAQAAILIGAFMSVSPWHVHFSRAGFESGMALAFLIWGVVGILFLLKKTVLSTIWQRLLFVGSVGMIVASLYTYHSSKIVIPLLLLSFAILYRRQLRHRLVPLILWLTMLLLLLVPLLYDSFRGQGGGRFQQATLFGRHLEPLQLITTGVSHFVAHFTPSFLIQGQTPTLRHGDGSWGILYLTEIGLIIAGIAGMLFDLGKKIKTIPIGLALLVVSWIIIGTIPAAIGVDVPHSNRMLLALPGFLLLAALGWQWIAQIKKQTLTAPAVLGMSLLLHALLAVSYFHHYYRVFALQSTADFSDGYLEVMEYAKQYEPGVDKILFTSSYDQPYIYALFSRHTSPYEYHNGALIKYEFSNKVSVGELLRKNTLIIGTPTELDPRIATHIVNGSDGKPRFVVVKTP